MSVKVKLGPVITLNNSASGGSRTFSLGGGSGGPWFLVGWHSIGTTIQVSYYELYTMQVFGSDAYSQIGRKIHKTCMLKSL